MDKKNFGILFGIILIILIIGYVSTAFASSSNTFDELLEKPVVIKDDGVNNKKYITISNIGDNSQSNNDKSIQYKKVPEFQKIDGSINSDGGLPGSIDSLKGKVVLIEFWTYSCINTLRTLPHLIDWDDKYSDSGLVIVGVHTPEFEFEKNTGNVQDAVQKYGIKYPVLQDNARGTWNTYENKYWPTMYLVDAQGYLRYEKIGEGNYDQTEKMIRSLLNERNANKDIKSIGLNNNSIFSNDVIHNSTQINAKKNVISFLAQPVDFSKIKTPESYFGNQSSQSALGNPEGFHLGQAINYSFPSPVSPSLSSFFTSNSSVKPNTIYIEGQWKGNPDNMELQSDTGRILLNYSAKSVNMVVGSNSFGKNLSQVTVYEDNSLLSNESKGVDVGDKETLSVDEPRLYNLVNHQSYDNDSHTLLIDIQGKGLQAYVFTFG